MTFGAKSAWSRYRLLVGGGWMILAIVAAIYARTKHFPPTLAAPVAAAFLLEFAFYLLPGIEEICSSLRTWNPARLATFMVLSAVAPWLVPAVLTGSFSFRALALLTAVAAIVSCWYRLWSPNPLADIAFLLIAAGLILSKVFDRLYLSPLPKTPISILGHLMLIRTAALSILLLRGQSGALPTNVSFRFLPRREEWLTGLSHFAMLLPVAGGIYFALGLVDLRPVPQNPAIAIGTFFGILWVVALSEEFFFRGLLQNLLTAWTGNRNVALVATSILFGSVHLGFRFHGGYPNWRFATVAAVAGLFYGLAARRTGSVQSSMVTHALTVTAWRVFLH